MLCIENNKMNYDSKFDVMYCTIGDTSNSYGDETIDNIIVLKDIDTDEITGYTIMNFKKICENKTAEYPILSKLINLKSLMEICNNSATA